MVGNLVDIFGLVGVIRGMEERVEEIASVVGGWRLERVVCYVNICWVL